jgi:hypothetical protein
MKLKPQMRSPKYLGSAGPPASLNFVAAPNAPDIASPLRQATKTYTQMHCSRVVPGGDRFAPHAPFCITLRRTGVSIVTALSTIFTSLKEK